MAMLEVLVEVVDTTTPDGSLDGLQSELVSGNSIFNVSDSPEEIIQVEEFHVNSLNKVSCLQEHETGSADHVFEAHSSKKRKRLPNESSTYPSNLYAFLDQPMDIQSLNGSLKGYDHADQLFPEEDQDCEDFVEDQDCLLQPPLASDGQDGSGFSRIHICPHCGYSTVYGFHLKTHIRRRHLEIKPYQCGDCEYSCGTKSDLTRHQQYRHTKEKPYKCKDCDYACVAPSNLRVHRRYKHSDLLSGSDMGNNNVTQMTLEEHSVSTHPVVRAYSCSECKTFSTGSLTSLKYHMGEMHKRKITFKCRECDYVTSRKGFIQMHYRTKHPGVKPYHCNKCTFTTCWPIGLKYHYINKHHEDLMVDLEVKDGGKSKENDSKVMDPKEQSSRRSGKPTTVVHIIGAREALEVDSGDQESGDQENLEDQAMELGKFSDNEDSLSFSVEIDPETYIITTELSSPTDKKEPPHYTCSECSYASPLYYNLLRHARRCHLKDKPFKCEDCSYATCAKDDLMKHRRYRHSSERPHKCRDCDYSSVDLHNLQVHYRFKHKHAHKYKCSECQFTDPLKNKVMLHYRQNHQEHPNGDQAEEECVCSECNFVTRNKKLLRAHFRRKHSGRKAHKCKVCADAFINVDSLNAHLKKKHSDVRPHVCTKCNFSSAWKGALTRHSLRMHSKVRPYQCTDCDFDASEVRDVERHHRKKHGRVERRKKKKR